MIEKYDLAKRPNFPNAASQARSQKQLLRYAMLEQDFQAHAAQWAREVYGDENAKLFGLMDTAQAPLPAQTRQLVTPGLYGRWPKVTGEDAGERMHDPHHGVLKRCGYWSRMAHVEYMTVGTGVYALRLHVVGTGDEAKPVLLDAPPHNIEVYCRDDDPLVPVELWELKAKTWIDPASKGMRAGWFWQVFDISDPETPTYRIYDALEGGGKGEDRTARFLSDEDRAAGYVWKSPEGKPFIPYAWYRAVDTGHFWPNYRNGLHQGTLRACAHWTHASHADLWASGEHNLVGGVDPAAFPSTVVAGENNRDEDHRPIHTFSAQPGAVTVLPTIDDRPLQVFQLRAGVNLGEVASFAQLYSMMLASADGLSPSDATRRSANPTSGAALTISNADKRAHTTRMLPLFSAADQAAIQKLAWMMEIATGEPHTPDGYAIEYDTLPLSPTERSDQREQLEWEATQGQLSPVDLHLRLHPSKTRSQALTDIVSARADERQIDQLVEQELQRRNVPAAEPEPIADTDTDIDTDTDENTPTPQEA